MQTAKEPNNTVIKLWNPHAAAIFSLLLSVAFGAWVHAQNWKALGREDKAKESSIWFCVSIVGICLGLVYSSIAAASGIALFVAWYFLSAKEQCDFVKNDLSNNYIKKSWAKPIGVLVAIVFAFAVIATAIEGGADSMSSESEAATDVSDVDEKWSCSSEYSVSAVKDTFNNSVSAHHGYKFLGLEKIEHLSTVMTEDGKLKELTCVANLLTNAGDSRIAYFFNLQENGEDYWVRFQEISGDEEFLLVLAADKLKKDAMLEDTSIK